MSERSKETKSVGDLIREWEAGKKPQTHIPNKAEPIARILDASESIFHELNELGFVEIPVPDPTDMGPDIHLFATRTYKVTRTGVNEKYTATVGEKAFLSIANWISIHLK